MMVSVDAVWAAETAEDAVAAVGAAVAPPVKETENTVAQTTSDVTEEEEPRHGGWCERLVWLDREESESTDTAATQEKGNCGDAYCKDHIAENQFLGGAVEMRGETVTDSVNTVEETADAVEEDAETKEGTVAAEAVAMGATGAIAAAVAEAAMELPTHDGYGQHGCGEKSEAVMQAEQAEKEIERQLKELKEKMQQIEEKTMEGKNMGNGEMDKDGGEVRRYKITVDFGEGSGVA